MKYSYEFKVSCVEAYKNGGEIEIPKGVNPKIFKDKVRLWRRMYDLHGPEVLKHKSQNTEWNAEKRMEIVAQVLAGNSIKGVAVQYGISDGQLYRWVRAYKTLGYNGLVDKPKGRKSKNMPKKIINPTPLTESEREELIRLKAENEYYKAENEAIKKEIALRHERWDAALKAKKQKLSKNSAKKDSD